MTSLFPIRHVMLSIACAACLFIGGMQPLYPQSKRIELPDLGASADQIFTDSEERGYARQLIFQLRQFGILVEDPLINEYFDDMGYRLVAHSDEPDGEYIFVVLDEPSLNAFATPGGVIALHSGMIQAAEEASEIAAVLAHEIAHVTQDHLERSFEAARQLTIPLALAALGLILVGGAGAIAPALIGTQGLSAQAQINFTRSNEYEADRLGIRTLYAAGFNPDAMASIFTKLGRASRNFAIDIPQYLLTHPLSTTRVAEAKNRAAQLPSNHYREAIDFHLMQARLGALYTDRPADAVTFFREAMRQKRGEFPEANRYGLVLALQRASRFDDARHHIDLLLAEDPDRMTYLIELAHIQIASGEQSKGLQLFAELYQKYTGNRILARYYAEALLTQEQARYARQALDILRTELHGIRSNASLHELMARAANQSGDDIRAASASAEALYWRGQIHDAINQLQRLNRRDDLDYYQRAKVTARLSEMMLEFEQLVRLGYISATEPI